MECQVYLIMKLTMVVPGQAALGAEARKGGIIYMGTSINS